MSPTTWQQLKLLALGCLLCAFALSLPIYLRAIDGAVVQLAGQGTPDLDAAIRDRIERENPGTANLLMAGANESGVSLPEATQNALETHRLANPEMTFWGGVFPEFQSVTVPQPKTEATVIKAFVNKTIRAQIEAQLLASRRPGVQTLLDNRYLTHTQIFPPARSAGGAPLDAIVLATAQLSQADALEPKFRLEIENLAAEANRENPTRPIESLYLDLLAFARQMNWSQFSAFTGRIESRQTLRRLSHAAARHPDALGSLFAIVLLSPRAADVADYLHTFPETGLKDLQFALTGNQGGLASVLARQERIYHAPYRIQLASRTPSFPYWQGVNTLAARFSWTTLLIKYIALLLGAFALIRFVFQCIPQKRSTPAMLRVDGVATLRQQVLALTVLFLAILLGEPFLAQKGQTDETPINWKFPTAPAEVAAKMESMMGDKVDEMTLLALVLFFLVQAGLYALGLVKLKELQKQNSSSRLKLKLLDNEDNMFDAGLYVGLGGTVISLLVLTMNLAQIGLMAAYASTLFGIIFVSLLKIMHVRPYRRKLLIESEAGIL